MDLFEIISILHFSKTSEVINFKYIVPAKQRWLIMGATTIVVN